MTQVYGFGNHNIHNIRERVRHLFPNLHCQLVGEKFKIAKRTNVVFVPKVSLLFDCRHEIAKANLVVLVFDSPYYLSSVKDLRIMDVLKPDVINFRFKSVTDDELSSMFVEFKPPVVIKEKLDVVSKLEKTIPLSCLNPILTFLYTITNKDRRNKHRAVLLNWFFTKESQQRLTLKLMQLNPNARKEGHLVNIIEQTKQPHFLALKTALQEIVPVVKAGQSVDYEKVGKQYKIAAYDLRYLVNYKLGSVDKSKKAAKAKKSRVTKIKPSR